MLGFGIRETETYFQESLEQCNFYQRKLTRNWKKYGNSEERKMIGKKTFGKQKESFVLEQLTESFFLINKNPPVMVSVKRGCVLAPMLFCIS